jgi:putative ABC transport system permease protein
MFKNYFLLAFRNLKKHPTFIVINILGLAVGMAASMLIFMFVQHELSYDRYHAEADRIYRVSRQWFDQDGSTSLHLGHAAPAFAPLLKADFSGQIEEAVRLLSNRPVMVLGERSFAEDKFFFADPEVFKVFSWEIISGDAKTALEFADGLVITQKIANKYFGNEDPIGKTLNMKVGPFEFPMQIRALMEDVPDNSHFKPEIIGPMNPVVEFFGGQDAMLKNFGSNSFSTFLLLAKGVDAKSLESQLPEFVDRHIGASSKGIAASKGTQLNLWPLTSIHLYSNLDSEIEANSNIEYVYIYAAIAIFILLIACINFMNLATARSAKRAMEVGLRKVLGADRGTLVQQFMGETLIMTFFALLIAIGLAWAALGPFGDFTGKEFSLNVIQHPEYLLGILAIVVSVGLMAGSYPALFLSGFQPVKVIKGTYKIGSVHEKFRSFLVVGQFAISILLIVSVLVVVRQLDYMKSKDLGFDKEDLLVLPAYSEFTGNYQMMRDRLLEHPAINELSLASRMPSGKLLDSQDTQAEVNGELAAINIRVADIHVSHSFVSTFGMPLLAGRDFDFQQASDSTEAFILNEAAVRAIGWADPEDAVQKQFHYGSRRGFVVGVVKDFHFESLHQPISPMVFMVPKDRFGEVAFKIKADQKDEALAYLRAEWQAMRPDFPFDYYLISDRFEQQYASEEKVAAVFGFFAVLAIVISILGLLGLSAYATEQRTKEIGIRKVMGATTWSVVALLGRDFLKLVLFGFLIAIPLGYFAMDKWLENFAYSTPLSWTIFGIAGISAGIIAALTISSQSIRAAMSNPVDAFKVN